MQSDRVRLFARLEELAIATTTVEHVPMFTVEQSQSLRGTIPGAHTKNLFLKDKNGALYLLTAEEHAVINLKRLHATVGGTGRVSFGKPPLLMETLGVVPGAVTAFGLIDRFRRARS